MNGHPSFDATSQLRPHLIRLVREAQILGELTAIRDLIAAAQELQTLDRRAATELVDAVIEAGYLDRDRQHPEWVELGQSRRFDASPFG